MAKKKTNKKPAQSTADITGSSSNYKRFNKNRHINELEYFNPYRLGNPYSEMLVKGFPVIFVTTPLLNLNEQNISNDEFCKYMSTNNAGLFSTLNFNGFGSGGNGETLISAHTSSPFMKILSNKFVNIDIKDTSLASKTLGETFYGYKMELPGPMVDSINGGQFSITFQETRDLAIAKIFKVWTDYMENVSRGIFSPSNEARRQKILDYTTSVYYFLLDFDGESIQYYAKYTGCMPLNVPYSNFQQEVGGNHEPTQLGIDFNYSMKEDMNPAILSDFNMVNDNAPTLLTGGTADQYGIYEGQKHISGMLSPAYENPYENINMTNFSKAGVFLEGYGDNASKKRYKLKFMDDMANIDYDNGSTTGSGDGDI